MVKKSAVGTMALWSLAVGEIDKSPSTELGDVANQLFSEVSGCGGGWLSFNSESELRKDNWANYFEMVYGNLPSFDYPLCIGDFWWFSDTYIEKSGARAPSVVGDCPSGNMDRYVTNSAFQRPHVSWSWHAPLYNGFPANTWVEVSHQKDYGQLSDEQFGMWLMYSKGNGIWFNTGTTKTYPEHKQWYEEYGVKLWPPDPETCSQLSAAAGYDSVQFNRHKDGVNYPCRGRNGDGTGTEMNIEILAVKLAGTYSCGSANGAKGNFYAGWNGSNDCDCDESVGYLNCRAPHALNAGVVV